MTHRKYMKKVFMSGNLELLHATNSCLGSIAMLQRVHALFKRRGIDGARLTQGFPKCLLPIRLLTNISII